MKIQICLFIGLLLGCLNSFSQIDGIYVSSGGGDAMSAVHLILTPDHTFAFTYFGGVDVGTWKENGKDTIEMTRADIYNEAFYVYGRYSDAVKKGTTRIQFDGCSDGRIAVSYEGDQTKKLNMTAVFNQDPNCFKYPYVKYITHPVPCINLSVFENNQPTLADRILEKKLIHTFVANNKYNDYLVQYNEKAQDRSNVKLIAIRVSDGLRFLESSEKFRRSGEFSDLSEENRAFLEEVQQELVSTSKNLLFNTYENEDSKPVEYYPIDKKSEQWKETVIDTENPLFVSKCD